MVRHSRDADREDHDEEGQVTSPAVITPATGDLWAAAVVCLEVYARANFQRSHSGPHKGASTVTFSALECFVAITKVSRNTHPLPSRETEEERW